MMSWFLKVARKGLLSPKKLSLSNMYAWKKMKCKALLRLLLALSTLIILEVAKTNKTKQRNQEAKSKLIPSLMIVIMLQIRMEPVTGEMKIKRKLNPKSKKKTSLRTLIRILTSPVRLKSY